MTVLEEAAVLSRRQVGPACHELIVTAPMVAAEAEPGQFVTVACGAGTAPLLRRPFSISDVSREEGRVHLLFRVVGKGTSHLAALEPGDPVSLMGPLGNGFTLPPKPATEGAPTTATTTPRAAVVGGGIGVAPLVFWTRQLRASGVHTDVFIGARTSDDVLAEDRFAATGATVFVATEDGSRGAKGFVTSLLGSMLDSYDVVYACGPLPMLRAVATLALAAGCRCQVAMEERMACGIGACQGCTCRRILGPGLELSGPGISPYLRVCRDGPAFWVLPTREVTA